MSDSHDEEQRADLSAAVAAFTGTRAWRDAADFIAAEAMYVICAHVVAGTTSVREAAKRVGVPKSTMARLVDKHKAGEDGPRLTPHLRADKFEMVHESVWGDAEGHDVHTAPFERVAGEDGREVIRFRKV